MNFFVAIIITKNTLLDILKLLSTFLIFSISLIWYTTFKMFNIPSSSHVQFYRYTWRFLSVLLRSEFFVICKFTVGTEKGSTLIHTFNPLCSHIFLFIRLVLTLLWQGLLQVHNSWLQYSVVYATHTPFTQSY